MLDGIWQDNFLAVKRVKQILPEASYVYKISYTLTYFRKCDLQQKQYMSNIFFQAVKLDYLYSLLVHLHIHHKSSLIGLPEIESWDLKFTQHIYLVQANLHSLTHSLNQDITRV